MPTYEYSCTKCGHNFELKQSISDNALTVCPKDHCKLRTWGKGKVSRLIGAGAGLIFKGSGFYITDYRSENYKASAKKESAASGGESKSESKSSGGESKSSGESKPAAPKAESKPATPKSGKSSS